MTLEERRAKHNARARIYRAKNRDRIREAARKYNARPDAKTRDPAKQSDYDRRRRETRSAAQRLKKTGVTCEQFQQALADQHGQCKICLIAFQHGTHGAASCAADHDHDTGLFRGVLCLRCNTGLGQFRDNPTLLKLAAQYLEGA